MPFKDKEKLKEWRRKWWSSLDPERKKEKQEKANNRSKKIKSRKNEVQKKTSRN